MVRPLYICLLLFIGFTASAQQYALFNTRTLFDAFENPAQKAFVLDSSRQFASNFLLPYLGANGAMRGNDDVIRRAINTGKYKTGDIRIGDNQINNGYQNSNVYLLTFRIFKSYKYQKELGFSWQLRSDANINYTNQILAFLDDYKQFQNSTNYSNPFNSNGYEQTYHQFSVTYRENYTKKLAFGIKLSLLSGIAYNQVNITGSRLLVQPGTENMQILLDGSYKASFLRTDEISGRTFIPNFKNPGASVSFGTTYKSKSGIFLMGNIKDLGFIKWANSSNFINLNTVPLVVLNDGSTPSDVKKRLKDDILNSAENKGFYSLTNAKADFTASKTFQYYTPTMILSKNLFFKGGDIALVNTFKYNDFSFSLTPDYNLNKFFLLGIQGMYQTPNFEVFLGSDNLLKTYSQVNGLLQKDATIGSGYNGASFYMGIGIKFGGTVEHPLNSSYMPGVGDDDERSFFQKIFSIFKKKKQ